MFPYTYYIFWSSNWIWSHLYLSVWKNHSELRAIWQTHWYEKFILTDFFVNLLFYFFLKSVKIIFKAHFCLSWSLISSQTVLTFEFPEPLHFLLHVWFFSLALCVCVGGGAHTHTHAEKEIILCLRKARKSLQWTDTPRVPSSKRCCHCYCYCSDGEVLQVLALLGFSEQAYFSLSLFLSISLSPSLFLSLSHIHCQFINVLLEKFSSSSNPEMPPRITFIFYWFVFSYFLVFYVLRLLPYYLSHHPKQITSPPTPPWEHLTGISQHPD